MLDLQGLAVLEGDVSTLWLTLDLARHLMNGYAVYRSQEIPQGQSVTRLQICSKKLPDSFLLGFRTSGDSSRGAPSPGDERNLR